MVCCVLSHLYTNQRSIVEEVIGVTQEVKSILNSSGPHRFLPFLVKLLVLDRFWEEEESLSSAAFSPLSSLGSPKITPFTWSKDSPV